MNNKKSLGERVIGGLKSSAQAVVIGTAGFAGALGAYLPAKAYAVERPATVTEWKKAYLMTPEEYSQRSSDGTLPTDSDLIYTTIGGALSDLADKCNTATIGADLRIFQGTFSQTNSDNNGNRIQIRYDLIMTGDNRESILDLGIVPNKYFEASNLTWRTGNPNNPGSAILFDPGVSGSGSISYSNVNTGIQINTGNDINISSNDFTYNGNYDTAVYIRETIKREKYSAQGDYKLKVFDNTFKSWGTAINAEQVIDAGSLLSDGNNSIIDCNIGFLNDQTSGLSVARGNYWVDTNNAKVGGKTGKRVYTDPDEIKARFIPLNPEFVDVNGALRYDPREDSDQDGLKDDWENYYFGDLTQTASGDFDGDGVSNIIEYNLGTDPTDGVTAVPTSTFNGGLTALVGIGVVGAWELRRRKKEQRKYKPVIMPMSAPERIK